MQNLDYILMVAWFALAVGVFLLGFLVAAPYGRHLRSGWGPRVSEQPGWVIMEAPAAIVFALFFLKGSHSGTAASVVFLAMWEVHYIDRSFIYPFRRHGHTKGVPAAIVFLGMVFNAFNGFLNSRYIFTWSKGYPGDWLADPRFLIGLVVFVTGFVMNRKADCNLGSLRDIGRSDYGIPYGGLYRWISCPNYLGEIIQWIGWAMATWSLPGLGFALWTAAVLVPRSLAHHLWYRSRFPDYPPDRKALIPLLW